MVLSANAVIPDSVITLNSAAISTYGVVMPGDDGSLYLVGSFTGTVDFDPRAGDHSLTSAGYVDTVIARYTAEGDLFWAVQIGGDGLDIGRTIALDRDGNVYVKGDLGSTTARFGETVVTPDIPSLYFVKLDPNGNFSWIITPSGSQDNCAGR